MCSNIVLYSVFAVFCFEFVNALWKLCAEKNIEEEPHIILYNTIMYIVYNIICILYYNTTKGPRQIDGIII